MDSGSGSLQSSSGGDEEYDSHQQPQLFPPPPLFFNNNIPPPLSSHIISSSASLGSSSSIPHHHQQQPVPFHYQIPPPFYDFPSNYNFNPDSSNSFVNLDVLRSEPTHFKNPPAADGSTQNQIPIRSTPSSSGTLHPKVTTKKRTRASRRAPTTVLTTDTTNFRAMVQEFTGIPSPPFTAGGSSYSRRFDLFGLVRTSNSTATNLETSGLGLYPSRSKVQLTNDDNVVVENQNVSNLQQPQAQAGGIFSFQSLSGHDFNSNSKEISEGSGHNVHGSTNQQLLSATMQNDETWRSNRGGTAAIAIATAAAAATRSNNTTNAANCKLNFTGASSSNNLLGDKEILLGNIVSTTRGESTVDSWISPSD